MQGDTSFQEKPSLLAMIFGTSKYSSADMKETWNLGIKHGIEIGLRKASIEGQTIELNNNTQNNRHKEFLSKFYSLANEYKCAIQYHPQQGMVVIDRKN